MRDIPQDIWEIAHQVSYDMTGSESGDLAIIARAILEERERCANVAEETARYDGVKSGVTWSSTFDDGYGRACTDIAAAIRKGGE